MALDRPLREVIAGQRLTLADVERVARAGATVRLDPAALELARAAHTLIARLAESGAALYGITTGSGANRTIRIPPEELDAFQVHLITSHCVGVGPPLPADVVRALMLVRAHGIAAGATGAHPAVAQLLVDLLNAGIHPIVPAVLVQWKDDEGNSPNNDKWGAILAAAGYVLGGLLHAQTTRDSKLGTRRLVEQIAHFCRRSGRLWDLEALRGQAETDYIVEALLTLHEEAERRYKERMQQHDERQRTERTEQAAAEQGPAPEGNAGWDF